LLHGLADGRFELEKIDRLLYEVVGVSLEGSQYNVFVCVPGHDDEQLRGVTFLDLLQ